MKIDSFETKKEALDWIMENVPACRTRSDAEKHLRSKLPPESFYQRKVIAAIKKQYPAAFVWKAAAGIYSRQGIPDVCAVINGYFYGFEIKRPYIGVLSPIQKVTIAEIEKAGGIAGVVTFPEEALQMIRLLK